MADRSVPHEPPAIDPIVADYDWRDVADGPIDASTSVRDGVLVMAGHGPSSMHGFTPHERPERDVVLDAVVRTGRLAPDEGFGFFVRRNAADRYVGVRFTAGRVMAISAFDGEEQPVAFGSLADGMILHPTRNRIAVAAIGPSITVALNGLVATSVVVDERFVDGFCGLLVEQRHDAPIELEVEWLQIRRVW